MEESLLFIQGSSSNGCLKHTRMDGACDIYTHGGGDDKLMLYDRKTRGVHQWGDILQTHGHYVTNVRNLGQKCSFYFFSFTSLLRKLNKVYGLKDNCFKLLIFELKYFINTNTDLLISEQTNLRVSIFFINDIDQ